MGVAETAACRCGTPIKTRDFKGLPHRLLKAPFVAPQKTGCYILQIL